MTAEEEPEELRRVLVLGWKVKPGTGSVMPLRRLRAALERCKL